MGKRVVITSFGSYGDVFPYLGLALGLKERGHHPVLAMPPFYGTMVEGAGFEFQPVRPDVDPADRETVGRIMDRRRGTEFIIKDLVLGSLRESYADLRSAAEGADLLVSHPITFAAPIVAELEGIRWVSTVLAPMSFFSAHDLPVFAPAPWAKRLERVPGAAALFVSAAKRIARRWVRRVYQLRAELGLPPGKSPVFEGQHSPYLVLGMFSRVLAEPQPDWPGNARITGFISYSPSSGERPLSDRLAAFLNDGPAPIVFTLGSSAVGVAGSFYSESAEAVRRLGVRAVLLAGPHPENRPSDPLPEGTIIEDFASHEALFPHASAIVHQGGAGTLHQGLRSGRPTLIVPFAHDQFDNAYRVAKLGVSRTLKPSQYKAERVEHHLRELLSDDRYATAAAAVAKQVREEDGLSAACNAIEEVMGVGS